MVESHVCYVQRGNLLLFSLFYTDIEMSINRMAVVPCGFM